MNPPNMDVAFAKLKKDLTSINKPEINKILVESCPQGLHECSVANMRSYGVECPIPSIAGQKFLFVTPKGEVCSLRKDLKNMKKFLPSFTPSQSETVDTAIEKISSALLQASPQLLTTALLSAKTESVSQAYSNALSGGAVTEGGLVGGFGDGLIKGGSTTTNSVLKHESNKLVVQSYPPDNEQYDENTIAKFHTNECPVTYGEKKWVKSRGSYAECERRLGFRWTSPSGHCYPEGLCSIKPEDVVDTLAVVQQKLLLLTTLTHAHNTLLKKERGVFLMITAKNLKDEDARKYGSGGKYAYISNESEVTSLWEAEAEKLLPEKYMYLPENAVTVTDELLNKILDDDTASSNDKDFIRSAFLQAFSDDIVSKNGKIEDTYANDKSINDFYKSSVICAKANYLYPNASGNSADVDRMDIRYNSEKMVKIGNMCTMVHQGSAGFYMPKLAASRKDGNAYFDSASLNRYNNLPGKNMPNPSTETDFEKKNIKLAFRSGIDPIALAFKFVSDNYMESKSKRHEVISSAYSPKRK
jgi:hypothetical protein